MPTLKASQITPQIRARLEAQGVTFPKGQKYNAQAVTIDGIFFASRAEASRYEDLKALIKLREIRGFVRQVTFELGCVENKYRMDFLVFGKDGSVWAEEIKGHETAKFKHDLKLWLSYGPCPLFVLKRSENGWARKLIEGGGGTGRELASANG